MTLFVSLTPAEGLSMTLDMTAENEGGTLTVHLKGELTLTESPRFRTWISAQLDSSPEKICVDCSRVTYIDSTGLGALIFLRKGVLDRGGVLRLTHVSGWLRKFLQVTGLADAFIGASSKRDGASSKGDGTTGDGTTVDDTGKELA